MIGSVGAAFTILVVLSSGEQPAIAYKSSARMEVCTVRLPSPDVECYRQSSVPALRDGWTWVDAIKGEPKGVMK